MYVSVGRGFEISSDCEFWEMVKVLHDTCACVHSTCNHIGPKGKGEKEGEKVKAGGYCDPSSVTKVLSRTSPPFLVYSPFFIHPYSTPSFTSGSRQGTSCSTSKSFHCQWPSSPIPSLTPHAASFS